MSFATSQPIDIPEPYKVLRYDFFLSSSDVESASDGATAMSVEGTSAEAPARSGVVSINISNFADKYTDTASVVLEQLVREFTVPKRCQYELFTIIKFLQSLTDPSKRQMCLRIRLLAISASGNNNF